MTNNLAKARKIKAWSEKREGSAGAGESRERWSGDARSEKIHPVSTQQKCWDSSILYHIRPKTHQNWTWDDESQHVQFWRRVEICDLMFNFDGTCVDLKIAHHGLFVSDLATKTPQKSESDLHEALASAGAYIEFTCSSYHFLFIGHGLLTGEGTCAFVQLTVLEAPYTLYFNIAPSHSLFFTLLILLWCCLPSGFDMWLDLAALFAVAAWEHK